MLKEEIVYIQVITTLQRIAEVLSWDIPESSKEKIVYNMHQMILTKYYDWRNLDLAKLSARIGILELDKIKNIVAEHNLKEDNFTEILTNELTNLKRHKKT